MTDATRRGLEWRMALALVLLAATLTLLVAGVFASLRLAAGVTSLPPVVAPAGTVLLVGGVAVLELRQATRLSRSVGDGRDPPDALRSRVVRLAAVYDVPPPTVRVVGSAAPETYTAGYRRSGMRLVLSTGLLDALDDAELDAVIAHELAHVAGRDAAVMTAVSTPAFLAEGICRRTVAAGTRNPVAGALLMPLAAVTAGCWALGRWLERLVSRYREYVADRAAARATGDPAAMASALETLDATATEAPATDLREAADVSALSVVPAEPGGEAPPMLGPEGDRAPTYLHAEHRVEAWLDHRLPTHPPLANRLDALAALAREK